MKTKSFSVLLAGMLAAVNVFAQNQVTGDFYVTGKAGIGVYPMSHTSLYLRQHNTLPTAELFGIYSEQSNADPNTGLYGADFYNTNTNSSSSSPLFGLRFYNEQRASGDLYGGYINNYHYHSTTTRASYGLYLSNYAASPNSTIYGVYSSVSGNATKKWAGYFTGGNMYVSGNLGIGTTNPQVKLDVAGAMSISGNVNIGATLQAERLIVNKPTNVDNWNNIWQSGFYEMPYGANANSPDAYSPHCGIHIGYSSSNSSTLHGAQIAISAYNSTMYFRSLQANGSGNWARVVHSIGNHEIDGTLSVRRLKVCLTQGCDYVFEDDYKLMSIKDLSKFVKTNKHLPEVAPAAQMESEGIDVSEMNALLLKKVEELTLYMIQQQETIDKLKTEVENLKNRRNTP